MKTEIDKILNWYHENKRLLPWRLDKNPYHVWISEIMLQQTRIEAVIDYYNRFLDNIPTIKDLATISEDKLLKLWEGLGYYNRARNLKKAAMIMEKEYHGSFPNTYEEILSLPGIGEYTASAIASICFNLSTPTVDGNVMRVYTRVNEDKSNIDDVKTKKMIRDNITKLIPKESGNFNEALMEIGETICLPNGTPKCDICPLKEVCKARRNNTWMNYPVKKEKKKQQEKKYTILILKSKDKYAIIKRENETLLNNLWGFPYIENHISKKELENNLKEKNISYIKIKKFITCKHIFTHQIWNMNSYLIEIEEENKNYTWASLKELKDTYAIPTAFKPFLSCINKKEKE